MRETQALLRICETLQEPFTQEELIERVMQQRPSEAFEMAGAWRHLVKTRQAVVDSEGPPPRYRIVTWREGSMG